MEQWRFRIVMKDLAVALQIAPVLPGSILPPLCLWSINRIVTGVVMAVTSFEFTFYAFLTLLAVTTADDTPFLEHLRADASTIIGVVRMPSPR
jgi:hypothetical protein